MAMQTFTPKLSTTNEEEEELTDDSGSGGRMVLLPNIYYDADNSGQTASSSTNYVYIKTQNAASV